MAACRRRPASSLPNALPDEPAHEDASAVAMVCYADDFLEQLHLWANDPFAIAPRKSGGGTHDDGSGRTLAVQNVMQLSAPAKAKIHALKAELSTKRLQIVERGGSDSFADAQTPKAPSFEKPKNLPKMPWRAHYPSRSMTTPVYVM